MSRKNVFCELNNIIILEIPRIKNMVDKTSPSLRFLNNSEWILKNQGKKNEKQNYKLKHNQKKNKKKSKSKQKPNRKKR